MSKVALYDTGSVLTQAQGSYPLFFIFRDKHLYECPMNTKIWLSARTTRVVVKCALIWNSSIHTEIPCSTHQKVLIAEWRGKSTSLLDVKLASLLSIELSPHLIQLLRLNIDSLGLA